jgi:hypothetical protein
MALVCCGSGWKMSLDESQGSFDVVCATLNCKREVDGFVHLSMLWMEHRLLGEALEYSVF